MHPAEGGGGDFICEKPSVEVNKYIAHCEQARCPVQSNVLQALKIASVTGELSLAGQSPGVAGISGLAASLRDSPQINVVNLADCMIGPPGLAEILDSLNASHVKHLNLHGNNIGSQTTAKLGRFLAFNKSLKVLNLKWNNLGISIDCFAIFCNGLTQNSSLEELDLRSNQLCAESAAHIATAIRANKSLKSLDLRWNNIQNEGAESLLRGIEENRSLTSLQLQGNCIHREVALAIDECIRNHATILKSNTDHEVKTNILIERIKVLEESRGEQLKEIKEKMSSQLEEAKKKLDTLSLERQENKKMIEELESKLFLVEEERKTAVQRSKVLEQSLKDRERAHKETQLMQQRSLEKIRQELNEDGKEQKLKLQFFEEQMLTSQKVAEESQLILESQKKENAALKGDISKLKAQFDMEFQQMEDDFESQKKAWKMKLEEMAGIHEDQIHRIRSSAFDKQQHLEEKITDLTEKQSGKFVSLMERCERLKQEKVALEDHVSSIQSTMSQLQRENSSLIAQVAEPARKLTALLDELSNEKIQNQKLKQEKMEAIRCQEELSKEVDGLKLKVVELKGALDQAEKNRDNEMKALKSKVKQLQDKVESKNKKIESLRNEEKARNKFLQSAFTRYFEKYNYSPNSQSSKSSGDS